MAILFGIVIGLALGLTGSGGSIFGVPLLIYGMGVEAHDAVIVSLAAVSLMAAIGAVWVLRSGLVSLRAGLIFSAFGMLGAPVGVYLGSLVAASTITLGFACLMLVMAVLMWIESVREPQKSSVVRSSDFSKKGVLSEFVCRYNKDGKIRFTVPCVAVLSVLGSVTGVLSGFFGVGGGFIIVPALTVVTRMSIHQAVATSLFVIALVGSFGVGSALLGGQDLPWRLTGLFVVGGVIGMIGGRSVADRLAGPMLQKIFTGAMFLVGALMIVTQFIL